MTACTHLHTDSLTVESKQCLWTR